VHPSVLSFVIVYCSSQFDTIRLKFRSYKSALRWLHIDRDIRFEKDLNAQLDVLIKGYHRTIASLKQTGDVKIQEGRDPLSWRAYRMIAEKLLRYKDSKRSPVGSCFAWPFLVIQWNLIARSQTVGAVLFDHISWNADSLLIFVPKHKADQEGTP
jgi:hypothetical protein